MEFYLKNEVEAIILRASAQEGLGLGTVGSGIMMDSFFLNRRRTQSMTRMMRCGGLPNFRTVAMLAGLMVLRASSASSRAGLAASSFSSAMPFSNLSRSFKFS